MDLRLPLAALWLALLAAPAVADEPLLTVEGLVSPAWVERDGGTREPLAVGTEIRQGERIVTGPGARVLLRMGEGSAVKLGTDAALTVDRFSTETRGASSLWQGSFDVLRGAFRYTTALLGSVRAERDLGFKLNTLSAGIRGTDIWGKSDPARDYIVLIEGRVTVRHAGRDAELDQPRSMFAAPKDGRAPPVTRISASELAMLSAETEILAGAGGARSGGRSRVVVITTVDETYARDLHTRLRIAGYPAELRTIEQEGSPLYQVHVTKLAGEREARTVAQRLRALGYMEARPAR
ncbi:MAG: hypothetical protein ACM3SS_12660 [Rhodospirillaceae bacterium]